MTVNIKNGPLAALLYAVGLDASNKGGRTRINSNATSAPLTTNDNTQGYQIGATWTRSDTRQIWFCVDATTNAAVWALVELSEHPGYVVGNWYIGNTGIFGSGTAPGSGSIRAYPFYLKERVTINSLGLRVTIVSAGGNVQAAIYANNPAAGTTGRPTGNALASTASMSTTTGTSISAAISVQLEPGLYWLCTNCDNGVAAFTGFNPSGMFVPHVIGSATQSNVITGSNGGLIGVVVTQTFGTWPDLTAASFVENTSGATTPLVQFKIGSVP